MVCALRNNFQYKLYQVCRESLRLAVPLEASFSLRYSATFWMDPLDLHGEFGLERSYVWLAYAPQIC